MSRMADGLDHFEGRSWTCLYRHALMTIIAFAFFYRPGASKLRCGKKRRRPASLCSTTSR